MVIDTKTIIYIILGIIIVAFICLCLKTIWKLIEVQDTDKVFIIGNKEFRQVTHEPTYLTKKQLGKSM